MKVSVIIPTLNEEDGIGLVLKQIPKSLNCEVIVVDGGSRDKTVEIAKKYGAKVIVEKREGYGRAFKTGFKHSKGEIIATLDGDATYNPKDIKKLLKLLEMKNLDFISGNRLKKLKKDSMGIMWKFGNCLISFFSNVLFNTRISDSQSGMWVFRKDFLKKMRLKEDGMCFSSEIKLEAYKKGKFFEYPIDYRKRKGKKKMKMLIHGFEIFKYLISRKISQLSSI